MIVGPSELCSSSSEDLLSCVMTTISHYLPLGPYQHHIHIAFGEDFLRNVYTSSVCIADIIFNS